MAGQQTQQDRQKAANPNSAPAARKAPAKQTPAQVEATAAKNLKATAPNKPLPKAKATPKAKPYQVNGRQSAAVRQANSIGGIGAG